MNIGLVDVDSCFTKKQFGANVFPNLALGKIAKYHKMQGDHVEWALAYSHYDIVYMSKVFKFTPDVLTCYNADQIIRGGTGYNLSTQLPLEIDRLQPDYSIYPHIPINYAYGFLTRGCPNKCPWCVVPKKEGAIHPYMDVEEIAIEERNHLILMDNNILAAGDYAKQQLLKIIAHGYYVDFNQALDARLMTHEFANLLAKVKWMNNGVIRFGCDTHAQIEQCEKAIDLLNHNGFRGHYFLYTMITNEFEESYNRIEYWHRRLIEQRRYHSRNYIYPYAQPFRDPNNPNYQPPQWQRDLARWTNNKACFLKFDFANYSPRKGFMCSSYFDVQP